MLLEKPEKIGFNTFNVYIVFLKVKQSQPEAKKKKPTISGVV